MNRNDPYSGPRQKLPEGKDHYTLRVRLMNLPPAVREKVLQGLPRTVSHGVNHLTPKGKRLARERLAQLEQRDKGGQT